MARLSHRLAVVAGLLLLFFFGAGGGGEFHKKCFQLPTPGFCRGYMGTFSEGHHRAPRHPFGADLQAYAPSEESGMTAEEVEEEAIRESRESRFGHPPLSCSLPQILPFA